jgi:vacuolar-type H+-ATPase subunit I/STV1
MENQSNLKINKVYLFTILLLMLILPVISIAVDYKYHREPGLITSIGKWFIFWAIGIRLLLAGIRQTEKPAFTLAEIFHIKNRESEVIVRELGFANICFGITAVLSIFIPEWRAAAGFTGGLYMGIAGVYHIIKKPVGANEVIAMVSDIYIFIVLAVYLYGYFVK